MQSRNLEALITTTPKFYVFNWQNGRGLFKLISDEAYFRLQMWIADRKF